MSFDSQRGVMVIIFGEVLVVLAKFLATDVVTLRCNRVSDMSASCCWRYSAKSLVER